MKLENKIGKNKERKLAYINFSNPWLGSLDYEHYTWKNHGVQSQQIKCWMMKSQKKIILKDPKQKITIKTMMIKIKIKKVKGHLQFFD